MISDATTLNMLMGNGTITIESVLADLTLLHGALDLHEVETLVDRLEQGGFEDTGLLYPPSYRTNQRRVFDDPVLAERLLERLRPHLPPDYVTPDGERWSLARLNPRFRACRYSGGQSFSIHRDGAHAPSPRERSFRTVMLYLDNDEQFEGGRTRFFADRTGDVLLAEVRPRSGTAAVFAHDLWHDGAPVTSGTKRVFRTDVIYRYARVDPAPLLVGVPEVHAGYVWCVAPLQAGGVASGSRDTSIALWSERGERIATLRGHTASVTSLTVAHGFLWSGSRDGTLRRWSLEGRALSQRDLASGVVLALAPVGDGVATASADGGLRWWDPEGEPRGSVQAHPCWAWTLASLGQGRVASAGEDGWVRGWSADGRPIFAFRAAEGPVQALLALPDGRLVTGSVDGAIRTWTGDGRLTAEVATHSAAVTALAQLRDGTLVSAGEDDRVVIHESVGTRVLRHSDFVRALAVTSDGHLVSGSYDETIHVHA
jgi:WD40 repeat protein